MNIFRGVCVFIRGILPERFRDEFCICQDEPYPVDKYFPSDFETALSKFEIDSSDETKIVEALEFCRNLYEEEDKRKISIDNKATILAGFSGTIMAGLLAIIAIFLPSSTTSSHRSIAITGLIVITFSIFFLVISISLALRVLSVKEYHRLDANSIFKLNKLTVAQVRLRRSASYFAAYANNQFVVNRNVDAFRCSRRYFLIAMMLILALAVGLSLSISIFGVTFEQYDSLTMMQVTTSTELPILTETIIPSATATVTPSPEATATLGLSSTQPNSR